MENNNKNHFVSLTQKIFGVLLIIIGFIGLFLPGLQGIAMIVAGAIVLQNKWLIKKLKQLKVYFESWWGKFKNR